MLGTLVKEQTLPIVVSDYAFEVTLALKDTRLEVVLFAVGLDLPDNPLFPLGVEVAERQGGFQRGRLFRVEDGLESKIDLLGVSSLNLFVEGQL